MTSEPTADSVSLDGSLVKYLQASRLIAIWELIPMDGITRDSGRANAYKRNIRRTESSRRGRFRRG